jgi:hypothetical protein
MSKASLQASDYIHNRLVSWFHPDPQRALAEGVYLLKEASEKEGWAEFALLDCPLPPEACHSYYDGVLEYVLQIREVMKVCLTGRSRQ